MLDLRQPDPNCFTYDDNSNLVCLKCNSDSSYARILINEELIICGLYLDSCLKYSPLQKMKKYYSKQDSVFQNIVSQVLTDSIDYYCSSCQSEDSQSIKYIESLEIYYVGCSEKSQCDMFSYMNYSSDQCTKCSDRYENCLSCDENECLVCPKGFYFNPSVYDYRTMTFTPKCVFHFCPINTCTDKYGYTCVTSNLNNCLRCQDNLGQQVCNECYDGYSLVNGLCLALNSIDTRDRFVRPPLAQEYLQNFTLNLNDGLTLGSPAFSITKVLNDLYTSINNGTYSGAQINIYLLDGIHYNFYCTGDASESNLYLLYPQLRNFCKDLNLYMIYPPTDNINITVSGLMCDVQGNYAFSDSSNFSAICATSAPTIMLPNQYSYFNISGYWKFVNLTFDGFQTLAVDPLEFSTYALITATLCQLAQVPNIYEKAFNLTRLDIQGVSLHHTCKDSYTYKNYSKNTFSKCFQNSGTKFNYEVESTLKHSRVYDQSDYFFQNTNGAYSKRQKTLFNLYAYGTQTNVPSLIIINCTFRYIVGDYDSLINVEQGTLSQTSFNGMNYYFYNGQQHGGNITLQNNYIHHTRFNRGVIYYRKLSHDVLYSMNLVNLTQMSWTQDTQDLQGLIQLNNNIIQNGNSFQSVTAFADITDIPLVTSISSSVYQAFNLLKPLHVGIVLNIEDYNGSIIITNNDFYNNYHFIAEYNNTIYQDSEKIKLKELNFEFPDGSSEWKLGICQSNYSKYMFGHAFDHIEGNNTESYYDWFERLSNIYLSRVTGLIYIFNNTFINNTGTYGGAISINSPLWTVNTNIPSQVHIENNTFSNNMAYLSGNAIYIRPTMSQMSVDSYCGGGISIIGNQFLYNMGTKLSNGGGITITCRYLNNKVGQVEVPSSANTNVVDFWLDFNFSTVNFPNLDPSQIFVDPGTLYIAKNYFYRNFVGQNGSAINLVQISSSVLDGNIYIGQSAVYARWEEIYSPFYNLLSQGIPFSFYDSQWGFSDEYAFMFAQSPYFVKQNSKIQNGKLNTLLIQCPQVKGAVSLGFCLSQYCMEKLMMNVEIQNDVWSNNDVGVLLNQCFISYVSSCVYINGGKNITFNNIVVTQNNNDYSADAAIQSQLNRGFSNSATAQLGSVGTLSAKGQSSCIVMDFTIEYELSKKIEQRFTFKNSQFYKNIHIQLTDYATIQYYAVKASFLGQLISFVTNQKFSKNNLVPILKLDSCQIVNNQFIGYTTNQIYVSSGLLQIFNTDFAANGYLADAVQYQHSVITYYSSSIFDFNEYQNILYNISVSLSVQLYSLIYNFPCNQFFNVSNSFFSGSISTYVYGQPSIFRSEETKCIYQRGIYYFYNNTFNRNFGAQIQILNNKYQPMSTSVLYMLNNTFIQVNTDSRNRIGATGVEIQDLLLAIIDGVSYIQDDSQDFITAQWMDDISNQYGSTISYDGIIQSPNYNSLSPNANLFWFKDIKSEQYSEEIEIYPTQANFINYLVSQYFNESVPFWYSVRIVNMKIEAFNQKLSNLITSTNCSVVVMQSKGNSEFKNFNFGEGNLISITSGSNFTGLNFVMSQIKGLSGNLSYLISCEESDCYFGSSIIEQAQFPGSSIIRVAGFSSLILSNFTFKSIQSVYSIISAKTVKYFSMFDSTFEGNACIFEIFFQDSTAVIGNTRFQSIDVQNNSILLTNSTLNFTNNIVTSNIQTQRLFQGFISVFSQSSLWILSCTFTNIYGTQFGIAQVMRDSFLQIQDSYFDTIRGGFFGTLFELEFALDVLVLNSTFKNTFSTVFTAYFSNLYLNKSTFVNNYQSSIVGSGSSIYVNQTTFNSTLSNTILYGSAINCYCYELQVINSKFANLQSTRGGAIYFTSVNSQSGIQSLVFIQNNTFQSNMAMNGGAITLEGIQNAKIFSNNFVLNNAYSVNSQDQPSGGAIFLQCINTQIALYRSAQVQSTCSVLIESNNFLQNNATQGGAIFWASYSNLTLLKNVYTNNTAISGSNFSSFGSSLVYQPQSNRRLLDLMQNITFVPGFPIQIQIFLVDQFGQIVLSDTSSLCAIVANNLNVFLYNNQITSNQGEYFFDSLIILATPNTDVKLTLTFLDINSFMNDVDFLSVQDPPVIYAHALTCGPGYGLIAGSCTICPANTYQLNSTEGECITCPVGGFCFNGVWIVPENGYQRSTANFTSFLPCFYNQSCLGGNESFINGSCTEGSSGTLCSSCISGWSLKYPNSFECFNCSNTTSDFIKLILFIAVLLAFGRILTRDQQYKNIECTNLIWILMNFLQLTSIISNVSPLFENTDQIYIRTIFDYLSISTDLNFLNCLFTFSNINLIPSIYLKQMLISILPFIAIIFQIFVETFKRKCNFVQSKMNQEAWQRVVSIFFISVTILHPIITRQCFLAFNCVEIDGILRYKEHISDECYQGRHLFYTLAVVMPSILIWVLGYPILIIFLMKKNRKIMQLALREFIESKMAKDQYYFIQSIIIMCRTLRKSSPHWFWVILIKKTSIMISVSLLQISGSSINLKSQAIVQVLFIFLFFLIDFGWQIKNSNYLTVISNQVENMAHVSLILTFYFIIWSSQVISLNEEHTVQYFMVFMIVLPTIGFLVYWCYIMRKEYIKELYLQRRFLMLSFFTMKKFNDKVFFNEYLSKDQRFTRNELEDEPQIKFNEQVKIQQVKQKITHHHPAQFNIDLKHPTFEQQGNPDNNYPNKPAKKNIAKKERVNQNQVVTVQRLKEIINQVKRKQKQKDLKQ